MKSDAELALPIREDPPSEFSDFPLPKGIKDRQEEIELFIFHITTRPLFVCFASLAGSERRDPFTKKTAINSKDKGAGLIKPGKDPLLLSKGKTKRSKQHDEV